MKLSLVFLLERRGERSLLGDALMLEEVLETFPDLIGDKFELPFRFLETRRLEEVLNSSVSWMRSAGLR